MEELPERGRGGDATNLHMENFLAACRSRNYKELHDGIANAYLSASLCHLANISYRTGHKLTLTPGPKFGNDPEANKMLTRETIASRTWCDVLSYRGAGLPACPLEF